MKLHIERAGAFTTVQDLGRFGRLAEGVPQSGAADAPALRRGNILLGNDENAAALEMTLTGDLVCFEGSGAIALTGGDLRPCLNGRPVPMWTVVSVDGGDMLSFGGACGRGVRTYLCVAGGIAVPEVMGSCSTYLKAALGGLNGRALKSGDVLYTGEPWIGWPRSAGFACPPALRPGADDTPLRAVPGPQDDLIDPASVETFFTAEWTVTPQADRMGVRLAGPKLKHVKGPDIVSDAIPLGAVQVPGSGQPIVMSADRQTTGGYVKIAVVHALDAARLAQKMPGEAVRFARISQEDGIALSRAEAAKLGELRRLVSAYSARLREQPGDSARPCSFRITVNGTAYTAVCEKIEH
ncbi:MAG: biotin-dependent carboxyltransferase family protein [Pyramidobacter sp.]|nr:biotin-dependent carboxyltransferase family protein [Pyramidobacter sp.]